MWNATFISNSASKRLIPVVYSTCSHCDDEYDSLIVPVNIVFLHSSPESMYSDCDDICDATFIINCVVKILLF